MLASRNNSKYIELNSFPCKCIIDENHQVAVQNLSTEIGDSSCRLNPPHADRPMSEELADDFSDAHVHTMLHRTTANARDTLVPSSDCSTRTSTATEHLQVEYRMLMKRYCIFDNCFILSARMPFAVATAFVTTHVLCVCVYVQYRHIFT